MDEQKIVDAIDRMAETIATAITNSANAHLIALHDVEGSLNGLCSELQNTARALESLTEQNQIRTQGSTKDNDAA